MKGPLPRPQDSVGTTLETLDLHAALEALGPGVVPALGKLLSHRDRRVRESAAQALARFKSSARSQLGAAVIALEGGTVMAASLIAAIGDESALPILSRRLAAARSSQEANQVANAIVGLVPAGASAPGPRRALQDVLVDTAAVPEGRRWAAYYLCEVEDPRWQRELGRDTRSLLVALGDPSEWTREEVMHLLRRLGTLPTVVNQRLIDILAHGGWTERPFAAATLGTSRSKEALPALSAALAARSWRLNLAAAQSLRRIGPDARALEALRETARSHWLPRVRSEAQRAVYASTGQASSSVKDDDSYLRFGSPSLGGRDPCSAGSDWELEIDGRPLPLVPGRRPGSVEGKTVPAWVAERLRSGDPTVLPVDDGWLVANPRGEFGGDLLYVPPRGPAVPLVDGESISFLGRIARRIVALQGTIHTGEGTVLSIERDGGHWRAEPFAELPATADFFVPAPDGSVVIPTVDGIVSLREDGAMRKMSCHDRRPDVLAILQASLDDAELRQRIRAVRGDRPLVVVTTGLAEDAPPLRFDGRAVTYRPLTAETLASFDFTRVDFAPGPVAVLTVSYEEAKIHFERLTFRRGPRGWVRREAASSRR
jgi:HEAT repeat protein